MRLLTPEDPLPPRKQRVRIGARWLDGNRKNWYDQIDTIILDMEDQWWCVLGQLWSERDPRSRFHGSGYHRVAGPYAYATIPELSALEAIGHGFAEPWFDERYDLLHRYWREEVYVRRRGSRR